jgi:hypothetical protein
MLNGKVAGVFTRLESTYSKVKLDAVVVFATMGLLILLMCAGAYQEAVRQASFYLGIMPDQNTAVMQVVEVVNRYGLAGLIAMCYFTNVSQGSKKRELFIDGISIAFGALLPQLAFHATWLYVIHSLITSRAATVSSSTLQAVYTEWLVVAGVGVLLIALGIQTWRILNKSSKAEAAAS